MSTNNRNWSFWFPLFIVILVFLIGFVGYCLDSQAFISNIISEIVGLLISIFFGLLVVDKYTSYYQAKQWYQVRNLTYKSIASHLCNMAIQALMQFPIKDNRPLRLLNDGRTIPNPDTVVAFNQLIGELKGLSRELNERNLSDITGNLYENIKWDLDQIQDVLTPRVVQSSSDQEFINLLIEFDNSRQLLHSSVVAHLKMNTNDSFFKLLETLDLCRSLYAKLLERWTS